MSKGVLLFAKDNKALDYIKQAIFCAKRVKKHLNVPVAIATDKINDNRLDFFDHVIKLEPSDNANSRKFRDGNMATKLANFNNLDRCQAYDLSPFEKTIVMDTDYVICNDHLKSCFDSNQDLMMYSDAVDLCHWRNLIEFDKINDTGINFYWATVVYFKKCNKNKIFFDLIKHVKENYSHYTSLYQIVNPLYRNDFAFSIAAHILNGFTGDSQISNLPGKKYFITDRDILEKINNDELLFLLEKERHLGEYTGVKTKNQNVHVMNKFSLERMIDE